MPISSAETIPNFPLNGNELARYVLAVVEAVLAQRGFTEMAAAEALEVAFANDWVFKPNITWPNCSFEIACRFHMIVERMAFTIEPYFRFPNNPSFREHRPFIRRPINFPAAPPLDEYSDGDEHIVDCFTIKVSVDDPNLVRIHNKMPILIQNKIPPQHGEMFPKIENHEVTYDPEGYPPLPDPEIIEESQQFAAEWGIPHWVNTATGSDTSGGGSFEPVAETNDLKEALQQAINSTNTEKPPKSRNRGKTGSV